MVINSNSPHYNGGIEIIRYTICKPGGNDTALVYGTDYTSNRKKIINNAIMARHPNVEQVGFIDLNKKPELQMAGGEFCGNATRSAANVYLSAKEGNIEIVVNRKDIINAGVDCMKNAWCEIPLYYGDDMITKKEDGIYIVKMNGMISVVIQENVASKYLENKDDLKKIGMSFIHKYNLDFSEAVGVMFCETSSNKLKINPVVWVKTIDTLFYETACGSGTTAVAMVQTYLEGKSKQMDIIQPSGMVIVANIMMQNQKISKAIISGKVESDNTIYSIEL